jgi:chaperonin GroEL (HSP60 family)
MAADAGTDAIAGARAVCDVVRTTLGPHGATKLTVGRDGTVTTASSGSLVLERLELDDPAFALLRGAVEDFRASNGDGAATVVALTGALLREAERLRELGLHPTSIADGYELGRRRALAHLDRQRRPVSAVGVEAVARTALTGTRDPGARAHVSRYLARVAETLTDGAEGAERGSFAPERVAVAARIGGSAADTELVNGAVLDKRPVTKSMPRSLPDVGVALLSSTVDLPRIEADEVSLAAESFDDRAALGEYERARFRESLDRALDAGCRFLVTERAVNERVQSLLASRGVLAVQRVEREDLARMARATGATVVPTLDHLSPDAVGRGSASVVRKYGRDHVVLESDAGEPVYTLFCRAPDPRSVETFTRSVEGALRTVAHALRDGGVVPGGGAIEVSAARDVRRWAPSVEGREQLAVRGFADALIVVPRTLAENAGMDPMLTLAHLGSAHSRGRHSAGIDATFGEVRNVGSDDPIVEPASLKWEIWSAATQLATTLVRVDERLPASDLGDEDESTGGPPSEAS